MAAAFLFLPLASQARKPDASLSRSACELSSYHALLFFYGRVVYVHVFIIAQDAALSSARFAAGRDLT